MQEHFSFAQALRVSPSTCIAFVGAGGKTTAMFQLARALSRNTGEQPVIVTATSHLGLWQIGFADKHIITETPAPLEELEHGLKGVILVTGAIDGERTKPINSARLDWLARFCGYHSIPLLIEADGSRQKPLKAWAEHEPPIPPFIDSVVQVVGLSGLGKPLTEEFVHRAEIFARISGIKIGELVTPEALVQMLTDPRGAVKNIPGRARKLLLLNQADTPELQSLARGLSSSLLKSYDSIIISSLEQGKTYAVNEHIAGIILAAGESTRYGQPKQLLDWKGEPFVRAVARTALQAGLSPVVVITGANAEKVESALRDVNVIVIKNEDWKSGQASSIKAGIKGLSSASTMPGLDRNGTLARTRTTQRAPRSATVGGTIFLLADQPQLTSSVIRALVEKHAQGLYPIVAPMVLDQRANPVLFDRVTFRDLLTLEGDIGGRGIFHKYRVEYLPWHDDRLLLDVDTPEMYQRLLSDDTL
ncbi:MAG TPA: selenium cofactor biosynthesis protein YqeC [Anaerolineales bacterium]|nr:selenium cofactor biosynthesis protein YqeC [Anaerolineales bacterium]